MDSSSDSMVSVKLEDISDGTFDSEEVIVENGSVETVEIESVETYDNEDHCKVEEMTYETDEITCEVDENILPSEITEINEEFVPLVSADSLDFMDSSYHEYPVDPPPSSSSPIEYYQDQYSWTESIETFLDRLNDFDYSYDHESETFELLALSEDSGEEEEVVEKLKEGQRVLVYLAVPILISQLLMLVILAANSSNAYNSGNQLIPVIIQQHHHHHNSYFYILDEEKNDNKSNIGDTGKKFLYVFFNPFATLFNNKYFKQLSTWIKYEYKKLLNDPNSFLSHFRGYLGVLGKGIESEVGAALKIRDNWNRAVYEKIYKIAASPEYQKTVATISKWACAFKDRIFKKNN